MPGRTAVDRGRDVRLQLLSTAAELIAELGWNAVSTRILAERAGVTPGLVHYHFPSLQALLRDAALGMMSDLLSAIEALIENAGWLAQHGADTPEDTASVLAAAIDGVILHRALNPALTTSAVAPLLRRLITSETSSPSYGPSRFQKLR